MFPDDDAAIVAVAFAPDELHQVLLLLLRGNRQRQGFLRRLRR